MPCTAGQRDAPARRLGAQVGTRTPSVGRYTPAPRPVALPGMSRPPSPPTHPGADAPGLLHQLFAATAHRVPRAPAVDVPPGPDRTMRTVVTYEELAQMARRVHRALAPCVAGEAVVAILLPRDTPWLYAAQIGILAAGAAFVGLDPEFPAAHLARVLGDARPVAIVTDRAGASRLDRGTPTPRLLTIEAIGAIGGDGLAPQVPAWLGPHSLAYVVYTSGTTGEPKGVLIEHRSITHVIATGCHDLPLLPSDRIAQGSSAAYDSSLEETWLAFAVGATVVVLDAATTRLGPDLVPWLRRERVTVLMPPPTLLRATGCAAPHAELPDLRLCYAGGEAMPQDLADRWSDGIWLENGYGPTECTVTVVRGRLRPGAPITIGRAIAGNTAHVLDGDLMPVPDGEWGELCIAGASLARGYLGRPEATTAHFPEHPLLGRIYRTGDRVRRLPDGALVCDGRIDTQAKVRGHRIELEAVETQLAALPGVRAAACALQGRDGHPRLVAFIVPHDAALPPDHVALAAQLRDRLPAAAVPSRFANLDALPTTYGGKLDRRALPQLDDDPIDAPPWADATPLTARIAAQMAHCLGRRDVAADADFFVDLGGESLRAAELVTALRRDPATAGITVRDVYAARTAVAQAARASATAVAAPAVAQAAAPAAASPTRTWLVTAAQTAWLALELGAGATVFYGLGWHLLPAAAAALGPVALLLLLPLVLRLAPLLFAPLAVAIAVGAKRLLVGRYRAGRVRVGSAAYLRHWLLLRAVRLVPWELLQGTAFQIAALRALGARIGHRVHIDRGVDLLRGGWDLLTIDDNVSLQRDAALELAVLDRGDLVIGPVQIGRGATIEVRATVAAGARIGANATVAALSWVADGAVVPDGQHWAGVPAAARTGAAVADGAADATVAPRGRELGEWGFALLAVIGRPLVGTATGLLLVLAWSMTFAAADCSLDDAVAWLHGRTAAPLLTAWTLLAALVAVPLGLLAAAVLVRWSKVPAGTLRRFSTGYLLVHQRLRAVEAAGNWLSGSVLWPMWLRLAGMRIGPGCEISTLLDALPEHTTIGADSFLADGIYLGAPRVEGDLVHVAPTRLGAATFLGNHVVVPGGTTLPGHVLLGVCTVADPRMRAGTDWFGHPPIELPRREIVAVDRSLTHEPGPLRYANRLGWELLRCGLAPLLLAFGLAWFDLIARLAPTSWPAAIAAASAASLAVVGGMCGLAIAMKWLLLGRVRPGRHGLWSCWCSRWDFLYVAWGRRARRRLERRDGTPWLAHVLRLVGTRIGRGVVLGRGFAQIVDPDMLQFDDGATVDGMFQAHSFEDRVLKIDRVRIGAAATLRRGALLFYGAELGAGARLLPHGVAMKHERLSPWLDYQGVPIQVMSRAEIEPAPSNL